MTQSCVSGDTYGRDWKTCPGRRANVGAKNGLPASSGERSETGARLPCTTRAFSDPLRSMKHSSPIWLGNRLSR